MLTDVILEQRQQNEYKQFITAFDDQIKTIFDTHWRIEGYRGQSCKYAIISQYLFAFSYMTGIRDIIKFETNNWSTINSTYSYEDTFKALECNSIDLSTFETIFKIQRLKYNYARLSNDYLEIDIWVKAASTVTLTLTSTGTHTIDWGTGTETTSPTHNYAYVSPGQYTIKVKDDLDKLTYFSFTGSNNNNILDIRLTENLTAFAGITIASGIIMSSTVDDIIMMCQYIAYTNDISTGTITLSGGTSDSYSTNSYVTYAIDELEDLHNWTITTN